jgi:hypothetical protein
MKLTRIVFAFALVLFAATALADRQEKTLICHVGNEEGVDAGKIDLIVVANSSNHLDNPSHYWDGISDYEPSEANASGDGTEDSDGNGVDDGCEPAETCPCWAEEELQAISAANNNTDDCGALSVFYPLAAIIANANNSVFFGSQKFPGLAVQCSTFTVIQNITPAEVDICVSQIAKRCADIGDPIILIPD